MKSVSAMGWMGVLALTGCAGSLSAQPQALPAYVATGAAASAAPAAAAAPEPEPEVAAAPTAAAGPWVGAAAESEILLASGGDAFVGVWVDVPTAAAASRSVQHRRPRAPVDLALVIDTSGSMEGAKIQAARASARTLVQRLADGDVVSVDTFSDHARPLVPPTVLTPETRARALSAIAELGTGGSTNIFEGLELAEMHVARNTARRAVRRIVLVSDGQANVGPSSPQALGDLAQRSLALGAQVTSLGVGLDYDERTLDAIADRTSGRLFHIGDPREMTAALEHEVDLLASTMADQAELEIVPAPGVVLEGVEGARAEEGPSGGLRVPLGALYAGQHCEALVRLRLARAPVGAPRALASVRLKFRDPADDGVERVQEVVARAQVSEDAAAVAAHPNATTRAMMATIDAAKVQIDAAQDLGAGQLVQAETQLAAAETRLRDEAARSNDATAKRKLSAAAATVASARQRVAAAPAAPPAKVRQDVLEMNAAGMDALGRR
jgi:Ca-activated chloride channel family protein